MDPILQPSTVFHGVSRQQTLSDAARLEWIIIEADRRLEKTNVAFMPGSAVLYTTVKMSIERSNAAVEATDESGKFSMLVSK